MSDSWTNFSVSLEEKARKLISTSGGSSTRVMKSCRGVLDHAPNIIQFATQTKYLGIHQLITRYVRQYQCLRDKFELRCPVCNSMRPEAIDCWGKTQMELESELLFEWSEGHQDEVCPKCRNTKYGLIEDGMLHGIDTSIGVVGMRAGKSVLEGIAACYFESELAIIGDIHAYFDVLADDPLQMSFVATTQTQSKETIFAKYRALRDNSPWFKRYITWVKEQEKAQDTLDGMRRWQYSEDAGDKIENGLLSLQIKSLNSNSSGLAGATRVCTFADELSRFDLSESARGADEVVKVLMQGLKTVRGSRDRKKLRPFWGYFAAVSSPISIDDQTMQMMRQGDVFAVGSLTDRTPSIAVPKQYSFHYETWRFNPDQPRESFDGDFIRDAVGAARDFGAQPPKAASPFIDDEARFRQAIDFDAKPTVTFRVIEPVDKTGRIYVGAQVADIAFDPIHVHYLHFDAGASFDTFGGCSAHGEWQVMKDPKTGVEVRKFITIIDWILGMKPVIGRTPSEKRTVWFDSVVDILKTLQKSTKVGKVTFDRWNAEKLIQDIRNLGIPTENRSITVPDFMGFLRASYEGDVRLLPPRPDEPQDPRQKNDAEKAIYELLRLERTEDLKRIYNPKKGRVHGMNSDDLAQVVVGAHLNVQSSVTSVSDSTSIKEVLRRENAGSATYYSGTEDAGGRVARGRSW